MLLKQSISKSTKYKYSVTSFVVCPLTIRLVASLFEILVFLDKEQVGHVIGYGTTNDYGGGLNISRYVNSLLGNLWRDGMLFGSCRFGYSLWNLLLKIILIVYTSEVQPRTLKLKWLDYWFFVILYHWKAASRLESSITLKTGSLGTAFNLYR